MKELLLTLDEAGHGVAIHRGRAYAVRGTYDMQSVHHVGTVSRDVLHLTLTLGDLLDEVEQSAKIQRLEVVLAEEREKLERITRLATGEEDEA